MVAQYALYVHFLMYLFNVSCWVPTIKSQYIPSNLSQFATYFGPPLVHQWQHWATVGPSLVPCWPITSLPNITVGPTLAHYCFTTLAKSSGPTLGQRSKGRWANIGCQCWPNDNYMMGQRWANGVMFTGCISKERRSLD